MINTSARFTIAPSERFAFVESQWKAVLMIVDSRAVRGGYRHTVAPVGNVDGKTVPVMRESFVVSDTDLVEVR